MTHTPSSPRIQGLDALRGFACLYIVFFHYLHDQSYSLPLLNDLIYAGRIGTDVFFIVSGLVTAIAVQSFFGNAYSIKNFLWIRVKKIYFTYWLSLVAVIFILPLLFSLLTRLKSGVFDVDFYAYSVSEWIRLLSLLQVFNAESWILYRAFMDINVVYWFIAVIVQMYIFVAICALHKRLFVIAMPLTACFSILMQINPTFKEVIPYGLFLEKFYAFYAGMLVYQLYKFRMLSTAISLLLCALAIAGIIIAAMLPQEHHVRLLWSICLIPFLWGYISLGHWVSRNHVGKVLTWVGGFSFTIYLLHCPFLALAHKIGNFLIPSNPLVYLPLIGVPLALLGCYLWVQLIERNQLYKWVVKQFYALRQMRASASR